MGRLLPVTLLALALAGTGCRARGDSEEAGGEPRGVYGGPAPRYAENASGNSADPLAGDPSAEGPIAPDGERQVLPGGSHESPDVRSPLAVEDDPAAWDAKVATA